MSKFRQGKRRRMTKFILNEISAVDYPAQEGARALLLKRRGEPGYDPKNPDPKKRGRLEKGGLNGIVVITSPADGHAHGVVIGPGEQGGSTWFASGAGDSMSHDHPWMMDLEGDLTVGMNDGHTHTIERSELLESFAGLAPDALSNTEIIAMARKCHFRITEEGGIVDLMKSSQEDSMTPEEIAALQKKNELLKLYATLNDAERTHLAKLDEAGKAAFLSKSAEARQAEVKAEVAKAAEENPVVEKVGDMEFRKNDDPRLIALAKQAQVDRQELAQERAINKQAEFEKRAATHLDALPGTVQVRAVIAKAIDGITDPVLRDLAAQSVLAGNAAMKAAFKSVGHLDSSTPLPLGGSEAADAEAKLEALAKTRAAEKSEDYYTAYEKVAVENPELAKAAIRGN